MFSARLPCLTLLIAVSACARPSPPAQSALATSSETGAVKAATAPVATTGPRHLPELAKEFEAERVTGSIAVYDTQDGVLSCSDLARCQNGTIPASTFKIPNSMIALETGVVEGPDTVLPWDRKQYQVDDWNQDLKFRDAFRVSCVPCYQAIARKVGEPGERAWVEKLGYGNRNIQGGVDRFWLSGKLRISPVEQIEFLRRFDGNELPISDRTADIVRDIMTLDVTETYVLRGKTGAAAPPEEAMTAYWFVGWLELGERRVFFATLVDGHAPEVDPIPVRRRVTERVLKGHGWM